MEKLDLEKVVEFINECSDDTKVYIGCDSYRKNRKGTWVAIYTTVVVVHIDGSRGCKIFYEKSEERDYDTKKHRPVTRMMNEVYKSSEMFLTLNPFIEKDIEVHVDIWELFFESSPSSCYGTSIDNSLVEERVFDTYGA